ncbi:MAG: RNA 2',3'-cyclic phosphodiesterase [Nanoarchaeota archaeon]
MKIMRLFIAIDFDDHKRYFNKIQTNISLNDAWSLESFHMTLLFLGEQRQENIRRIVESLRSVNAEPFFLTFNHVGVFSVKRRKDIFWVGVKEDTAIRILRKKIISSLQDIPLKLTKRFVAHVTIARRNRESSDSTFHASRFDVVNKTVRIRSFKLIQSTLTSKGPIYTVIEELMLEK